MFRRALSFATVVLVLTAGTVPSAAQTTGADPSLFTVDDVFDVTTIRVLALSPDGNWVVVSTGTLRDRLGTNSHRTGDPTYVAPSTGRVWLVDTRSGNRREVFDEPVQLGAVRFAPDGGRFAITEYRNGEYRLGIYEVERGRMRWQSFPRGTRLAGEQGQAPEWSSDGVRLLVPARRPGWLEEAQAEFERLTRGPITVYRGDDPFLAWEALRRRGSEVQVLAYDVEGRQSRPVLPPTTLGRDGFSLVGDLVVYAADVTEKTSYDVIFGSASEIRTVDVDLSDADDTDTLLKVPETRRLQWSADRRHYAYSERGEVLFGSVANGGAEPVNLTGPEEADEATEPSATEDEDERERFSVLGVAPDGSAVVASSDEGTWLIEVGTRARTLMIPRPEGEDERETAPRHSLIGWSPAADRVYFQYDSRKEWDRGVALWDRGTASLRTLFADDRLYSGFQLSDDGSTFVFTAAEGNRPLDLYVADADFGDVRLLFETNPTLVSKSLGRTELIDYLDVDGDRLYGVLYYPVGYAPGTAVPTVFLVYEDFFDDRFNSTIAVLNNAGYAVVQPSVDLEIGFPGEAWLKGVTAAANSLIDRGIADPKRLGVHGTSYGGYATNLLVTQTARFAAAINISGKVDMISFYTDSPRLGVRNIHAPENSQDRIGATLWEQPQKYIAHSAIMSADRIETPLLLITGEQDHNVPARTTLEMYYALRRLGKTVEWVNYVNGGHGMPRTTEEEVRDYFSRILGWYDRFLKNGGERAAADQGR